ncbi:hypothetical protein CROQUDRAFT_661130 [Cronartium quercuum f. sp. fusiforme G11]|uniref:Uncharacterized protein n=1 Tax=Cronartium quercuum f. sp. fusiforme G11 TaxID=708437 RepID=A0A9P6NH29_9BASI|nr:hypothetical protein CROQUDRAFT_661130 [Cronartium quercuum f. sp. fusiforme G11]
MPQQLLSFPPTYLFIGLYRLVTDPKLWHPIWIDCKSSLKKTALISSLASAISYPLTRVWVRFFMRQSSLVRYTEEASFLRIPVTTLATLSLVAAQASWLVEFSLKRKLRAARSHAYKMTTESRAKDPSFWGPYAEEWEVAPVEKARKLISKRKWYRTVSGPLVRLIVLKLLLMPLHFVPFLTTLVSSFLASLTLSERLLEPYFSAKKMSELEVAIFVTERERELRLLGFSGSILEAFPLLGIIFSISNRVGVAMYAHDLEKRQEQFRTGKLKPFGAYQSRTQAIELDLPKGAIGNFPKKESVDEKDKNE